MVGVPKDEAKKLAMERAKNILDPNMIAVHTTLTGKESDLSHIRVVNVRDVVDGLQIGVIRCVEVNGYNFCIHLGLPVTK